ncbi:hypothetical protein [Roseisolibacter agri]|uniref:Uncharacterized protein n=1 Tax=Roseisolibacter agri TaxID=2014610 RepID=A0AA37V1G9_9BACT|nr:hypothetical protein [Roseisolibacter agri]GLC23772.1 hypothetical protein rosag_02850 [Roseisolibacter agri]
MSPQNVVELADRVSRKRAIGTAAATTVFLAIQVVARPVFRGDGTVLSPLRANMWALNAGILLLLLLPIGGYVFGARVRALVNDDVSRHNSRLAATAGFWVAMLVALAVYALPAAQGLTAREATYLVVTPAVGVALLAFAWCEARALRDG